MYDGVESQERLMSCSRRFLLIGLPIAAMVPADRVPLAAEAAPAAVEKRLALSGYDPVSYFTEGRPEKGSAEYSAAFDDATYWFKSAEHRATFAADPDHYAPQFAGYCAVSLSRGAKYEADPEAWAIADGRLYVFGSKAGVPVFRAETASVIEKATENWAKLRDSP
jgi:YHS domain-containing protein